MPTKSGQLRLSMNLTPGDDARLMLIAKARSSGVTEAVRSAIRLFAYICTQPIGTKVIVQRPDGTEREVILL